MSIEFPYTARAWMQHLILRLVLQRIQELSQKDANMVLRLRVDAGGCSGFSYKFDLETDPASDDM